MHLEVQEEGLKDLLEGAQIFGTLSGLVAAALSTNDKALSHPALRAHLDDPGARGFDVVLVSPFLASEAGYYLAHRFDAAQVVYVTVQASASFVDYAVGMPHNPAYLPMPMMPFLPPMTFLQRVVNTLASVAFQAGRWKMFKTKALRCNLTVTFTMSVATGICTLSDKARPY